MHIPSQFDVNQLNTIKIKTLCEKILNGINSALFHGENLIELNHIFRPYLTAALMLDEKNQDIHQVALIADELLSKLNERIERIITLTTLDIQSAVTKDPSSPSKIEVLLYFPGIKATILHRFAHLLHQLSIPILPRAISAYAHSVTGIDIHPEANIGKHFFIDHGTGIVIGQTCSIGDHVSIYQGVTLGTKAFKYDGDKLRTNYLRHPTIEDHVSIYANATILGAITIGQNSIIGSNVTVSKDIPPNSKISQSKYTHHFFTEGEGI
ncbi:serine O-acetyltransferase EpsC [Fangia hongkongensis]|uniref:serine O-acetyltransferase EpsC n=1 Tax=Fangia hongkongensis TaxID=270495 RepID=UPI000374E6FF|nr:serine O-acetyltransferase EpsC [Fangia hongkongensis]MBK2123994.1 serine acetyltransferase [Fangia hongkongensis]